MAWIYFKFLNDASCELGRKGTSYQSTDFCITFHFDKWDSYIIQLSLTSQDGGGIHVEMFNSYDEFVISDGDIFAH